MTRDSFQRAMAGVVAAFLALAGMATPAWIEYRCEMMGTVLDRPCCPELSPGHADRGPSLSAHCCTAERHVNDRTPADTARTPQAPMPPALLPARAVAGIEGAFDLPPVEPAATPPTGPPLRLRTCSFLI
jgi:hypothetical protein